MKSRASIKDIDWHQNGKNSGIADSGVIDSQSNENAIPGVASMSVDGSRIAITRNSTTIFLGKGLRRSNKYVPTTSATQAKSKPIAKRA
jgi:hypothetical protein